MIYIASDHAGFTLKKYLYRELSLQGIPVTDLGPFLYDEADDYPETLSPVWGHIKHADDMAIIIGGSGQGEAIAANRHAHIRAVVYYGQNLEIIRLSREHNDSNTLSLGARFLTPEQALEAVQLWINTPFTQDERHIRRIAQL